MDNKCFTTHGMAIFGFKSCRCCKQWCLILLKQRSLRLSVLSSASHQGCFSRYNLYTPVDIYAYTQDSNQLAILIMARFNKDTGNFAVSNEHIVGPFNGCCESTDLSDCVNDSKRGNHHQQVRWEQRPEQCRRKYIASRHIHPAPALPAFTGSLTVGKYHHPLFWPLMGQLHC